MRHGCKVGALTALFLAGALAGCPTRPPPSPAEVRGAPPTPPAAPHAGQPYEIAPGESLLTVLVYRAGALAAAGHNHVIASHALRGTVYVPGEVRAASFEVHVAVEALTVDEPQLRAQQGGGDFPPDVSESAREGTRRNMLGPALLDAADYPEVVLRAVRLDPAMPAAAGALTAHIDAEVRGQHRAIVVPVRYAIAGGTLEASGAATLRQSALGLTPFTALLGALAVQDEMRLSFRIVAHAAPR
ncbi:MAG TPA: YceI family protein [Steroidobacteraceae bacterium]|nr:YceI family protein [Steroidobacteraceae bacterium]